MGLISRVSSRTYRNFFKMQIFVTTHTGTKTVEAETIGQLLEQFPNGRLLSNGLQLNDSSNATLEDLGIQEDSTIAYVHPVLGGGRKRKKKVYTTPKKIKHKRVKVKLATLKYYKVDDTGKVERKRKECPHETCGAGIFMSNHKDRHYCGKCGLTIKFDQNQ